mmetsp:Transcript_1417/g.3355  ORF Transcript_1417/g.3355 Transcript_1417/m.3355 type:complete len:212 (+) Transcript_1417:1476-2111(+)
MTALEITLVENERFHARHQQSLLVVEWPTGDAIGDVSNDEQSTAAHGGTLLTRDVEAIQQEGDERTTEHASDDLETAQQFVVVLDTVGVVGVGRAHSERVNGLQDRCEERLHEGHTHRGLGIGGILFDARLGGGGGHLEDVAERLSDRQVILLLAIELQHGRHQAVHLLLELLDVHDGTHVTHAVCGDEAHAFVLGQDPVGDHHLVGREDL